jgi:DNA mismatch endonuclease (patch repair protein)
MDHVDKVTRSRMMASVRSKNTAAEIEIRHRVFRLGFRYRLHVRGMPGRPDMVFPRYRAVVFINGCFWHNHDCRYGALPTTRQRFWRDKLEGNRRRDEIILSDLREAGWRTMVVWECSIRTKCNNRDMALEAVAKRVGLFLISRETNAEITGPPTRAVRVWGAGG